MPSAKEKIASLVPLGLRINPPLQVVPVVTSGGSGVEVQLQGGFPTDLPLLAVIGRLRYRASVTTAATAVNADGALGLLTLLRVVGQHKRAGEQSKIVASAPDIEALNQQLFGSQLFSNGADTTLGTAVANYDIDVRFMLPLSYLEAVAQRHWEMAILGLLNGPDYTRIDAFATFGGFGDLYDGGAGTVTGYGGTGSPQVTFEAVQCRIGQQSTFRPFFVERITTTLQASAIANGGTDIQIYPKLQVGSDYSYSSLSLKQFIAGSGTSNAKTLLDGATEAVTRFRVKVDSKDYVKSTPGAAQYWSGNVMRQQSSRVQGYSLLDWANGNPDASFPTYAFAAAGKNLNLYGDVTATTNAQLSFISNGIRLPR